LGGKTCEGGINSACITGYFYTSSSKTCTVCPSGAICSTTSITTCAAN